MGVYRPSTLVIECPTASADGLYHGRYPHGNAPAPSMLAAAIADITGGSANLTISPATGAQLAATVSDVSGGSASLGFVAGASIRVGSGALSTTFVDQNNNPVQLMGFNVSGMEDSIPQGFEPWADDGGTPDWAGMRNNWGANFVRLPVCSNSILGDTICPTATQAISFTATPGANSTSGQLETAWPLASGYYPICGTDINWSGYFTQDSKTVTWPELAYANGNAAPNAVIWGTPRSADPYGNAVAALDAAIAGAQQNGMIPMIDMHRVGPYLTFGQTSYYLAAIAQQPMADYRAIAFWEFCANRYGTQAAPITVNGYTINNNLIVFGLCNEPRLSDYGGPVYTGKNGTGTKLTQDTALLTSGWASGVVNQSQGGTNYSITAQWQTAGYQDIVNAIRATGAQNPCGLSGNYWSGQVANFEIYTPIDSANQLFYEWHAYPNASSYANETADPWPSNGVTNPGSGTSANYNGANSLIAAGKCLFITEYGDYGGTTITGGCPSMTNLLNWIFEQTHPVSNAAWQFNSYRPYNTTSEQFFLNRWTDSTQTAYTAITGCGTVLQPRMLERA